MILFPLQDNGVHNPFMERVNFYGVENRLGYYFISAICVQKDTEYFSDQLLRKAHASACRNSTVFS